MRSELMDTEQPKGEIMLVATDATPALLGRQIIKKSLFETAS
jgi:hypothetical protein